MDIRKYFAPSASDTGNTTTITRKGKRKHDEEFWPEPGQYEAEFSKRFQLPDFLFLSTLDSGDQNKQRSEMEVLSLIKKESELKQKKKKIVNKWLQEKKEEKTIIKEKKNNNLRSGIEKRKSKKGVELQFHSSCNISTATHSHTSLMEDIEEGEEEEEEEPKESASSEEDHSLEQEDSKYYAEVLKAIEAQQKVVEIGKKELVEAQIELKRRSDLLTQANEELAKLIIIRDEFSSRLALKKTL